MTPYSLISRDCVEQVCAARAEARNGGPEFTVKMFREMVELACQKAFEAGKAEGEKEKKARKKAGIHESAKDVYAAYPRHEGGQESLVAISKAINEDGLELVLERTKEYGAATKRWARDRLRSRNGSSLIPMATTWFNGKRYKDNTEEWWKGTGTSYHKLQHEETKDVLLEPTGWKLVHSESRYVKENIPWEDIEEDTQRWLIENTPIL